MKIDNEKIKWYKMVNKYLTKHNLDTNDYYQGIEDLKIEWLYANAENRKEIELDIVDYCERI